VPLDEEISLERGREKGYPLINRYFTPINSFSVKTVADRQGLLLNIRSTAHELAGLPTSMTLNDPETEK